MSRVFDGSEGRITNGFVLHGVGVNNMLLKLETHDGENFTQNQIRRRIVEYYAKVQFICRLRDNRKVVIKETGVVLKIWEIPPGKYSVYLFNAHNTKVDRRFVYTLVIRKHLKDKKPIRFLFWLKDKYSIEQIVDMYLQRWGIENIFKRAKHKFNLEKIRALDHQKFVNLICLIQFAGKIGAFLEITTSLQHLHHRICHRRIRQNQNHLRKIRLLCLQTKTRRRYAKSLF